MAINGIPLSHFCHFYSSFFFFFLLIFLIAITISYCMNCLLESFLFDAAFISVSIRFKPLVYWQMKNYGISITVVVEVPLDLASWCKITLSYNWFYFFASSPFFFICRDHNIFLILLFLRRVLRIERKKWRILCAHTTFGFFYRINYRFNIEWSLKNDIYINIFIILYSKQQKNLLCAINHKSTSIWLDFFLVKKI